ncbi:hypothetical protein AMS68_003378 [Peltaster fructicola]|uniref:Uncharacterized protein n=1 Tax=Peltaster fructicola TaxID=286661 RepID=A0A6H0XT69_9PEZI|nr:hypothetical protein AMS68_003378 [Peltaster fructicola]
MLAALGSIEQISQATRGNVWKELTESASGIGLAIAIPFTTMIMLLLLIGPPALVSLCLAMAITSIVDLVMANGDKNHVGSLPAPWIIHEELQHRDIHRYGMIHPNVPWATTMLEVQQSHQRQPIVVQAAFYGLRLMETFFFLGHSISPGLGAALFLKEVRKLSAMTQWTAFVIYHILTLTVYYTTVFTGAGTVNPGWVYVLG